MNPTQREAALRLAAKLDEVDVDPHSMFAVENAAALLRELAQEPQAGPVAAERERCARLAETLTIFPSETAVEFSKRLAAAIREQEPQADPVAYLHREEGHADVLILAADWDGPCADCTPLYAHPPQQRKPLDITLDQAACELLFKMMHPATPESEEYSEVRLQLAHGHSGYGLYVSLAEYPEEGAELLHGIVEAQ